MTSSNIYRNQQQTADNFVDTSDPQPILKRNTENLRVIERNVLHLTRDVSNDTIWQEYNWGGANWDGTYGGLFILGHPTYSTLGVNKLGSSTGDLVVAAAGSYQNTFIDDFDWTTYSDDINTTADLSTVNEVNFTSGEIYQSIEVYKDIDTKSKATLTVTIASGDLDLYMWTDSNTPELVSNGVEHTFSNLGTTIKYKLVAGGGASFPLTFPITFGGSSAQVTRVECKY